MIPALSYEILRTEKVRELSRQVAALPYFYHLKKRLGGVGDSVLSKRRGGEIEPGQARELAKEHDLEEVLVDIHMALGDYYYWSKGTRRQFKALRCYIAGMVACAKPDVLSKVGVHIFGKVFGIVDGERVRRINALRTRLERWLESLQSLDMVTMGNDQHWHRGV